MAIYPELKGKNAVVTGGSRGIGAQIALDLAKQGVNVLVNYTSPSSEEKSNAVVAAIEALGTGAKAWTFKADVGARDAGKVFLDGVNATFGPNAPVDIVVHNAAYSPDSAIADITVKEFDLTINVGLRGPLLITQGLLPRIPTGKDGLGGRIIMMSSVGARAGLATQTSYAATKSGLEGMMKVFATELRPSGITVNCVNPGPVKTEMWLNTPQDILDEILAVFPHVAETSWISDPIVWLASESARWITGSIVSANNGALYI